MTSENLMKFGLLASKNGSYTLRFFIFNLSFKSLFLFTDLISF